MRKYFSKLCICFVCFLPNVAFGQADSLLVEIISEHYSDHDSSEISKFEMRVNQYYYYDKSKSVGILIDSFGADYYTKSIIDLRKEINNRIMIHQFDSTENYSFWENKIGQLSDSLGTGKIIYPENQIWDQFLTFDFPKDPYGGKWSYSKGKDTLYNFVKALRISNDPTLKTPIVVNSDSIKNQIENIPYYRKRWDVYFLFLMNLFVNEMDFDLAEQSYQLMYNIVREDGEKKETRLLHNESSIYDTLIGEEGKITIILKHEQFLEKFGPPPVYEKGMLFSEAVEIEKKLYQRGDTTFYKEFSLPEGTIPLDELGNYFKERFGIESHLEGDYTINPYEEYDKAYQGNEEIDTRERLKWVIGCIKFLATRDCMYHGKMSDFFGVAYGLIENKEDLQEEYLFIRLLEVQFYDALAQKFIFEQRFSNKAINNLKKDCELYQDSSHLVFFQQNYFLAKLAMNLWLRQSLLRNNYRNGNKLQVAQWLFNASVSVDHIEIDTRQKVLWKIRYLELLVVYYTHNFEFVPAVKCIYQILDEVHSNPNFFSKEKLEEYIYLLCYTLKIGGFKKEFESWIRLIDKGEEFRSLNTVPKMIESAESGLKEVNLTSKIVLNTMIALDLSEEFFTYKRSNDIDIPYVSMVSFESELAKQKRYRKAYKAKQYLEKYGDPRNNDEYLWQINRSEVTELRVRRQILNREKKELAFRERILDSLSNLYGTEVALTHSKIIDLNYDLEDQEKKSDLLSIKIKQQIEVLSELEDSISREQIRLNLLIDSNLTKKLLIDSLDTTNSKLTDEKLKLERSEYNLKKTVIERDQVIVYRGWIIVVFVLLFVFAIVFGVRASRNRKKAEEQKALVSYQKRISDSLRYGLYQISHTARNTIDKLNVNYIDKLPDFKDSKNQKIKTDLQIALDDIRKFLISLEMKNSKEIIMLPIEEDVRFGVLWAQMELGAYYDGLRFEESVNIEIRGADNIHVPIYCIANIIHNSCKYTDSRTLSIVITCEIFSNFITITVKDKGEKIQADSSGDKGLDYIQKVLAAHNGPHFDAALSTAMSKDKQSFTTTFNIKLQS